MKHFHSWVYLLKVRATEFVRVKASYLVANYYLLLYFLFCFSKKKALTFLLCARRAYPLPIAQKIIKARLGDVAALGQGEAQWFPWSRMIILKYPTFHQNGSTVERGVVLIKFTETFLPFLQSLKVAEISKYFRLVLEPSWSGYALESILAWTNKNFGKILVCCPESDDFNFIGYLQSNLAPIKIGASDWVDDRIFFPVEAVKDYDSIYVANYNPIKRLHRYFKAIARVAKPNYKGAIVCSSWGGGRKSILELIDYYKIQSRITVFEDLDQKEINGLLNKSKVNLLLSYKEGANKSLFEAFFSGVPGIALKNNIGVNKDHINAETGCLIDDSELEEKLNWFVDHWKEFNASGWARENISPPVTTKKLEGILQRMAAADGEVWTEPVKVKVNCPEASYYDHANYDIQKFYSESFCHIFSIKREADVVAELQELRKRWDMEMIDMNSRVEDSSAEDGRVENK
ncbi:MAG: glycosyltransferase [Spongiibacteraceae bacterium]